MGPSHHITCWLAYASPHNRSAPDLVGSHPLHCRVTATRVARAGPRVVVERVATKACLSLSLPSSLSDSLATSISMEGTRCFEHSWGAHVVLWDEMS
jgi:hypothetical protein